MPYGAWKDGAGELTNAQRTYLEFGPAFQAGFFRWEGEAFASDAEARACWAKYGKKLMAEWDKPGRRPWGFWKYDLAETPEDRWQELILLERYSLLDRAGAEEAQIEKELPELNPHQSAGTFLGMGRTYGAEWAQEPDNGMLESYIGRFHFAEDWHARRGRVELVDKFHRLAAELESYLVKGDTQ